MARRAITISLPDADPDSQVILAWLDQHAACGDMSRLLRGVLVRGIDIQASLARIEQRLDEIQHRNAQEPPRAETVHEDAPDQALLSTLFDFGSV